MLGGGSIVGVRFLKRLIMMHCMFIRGCLKSTVSKYAFRREEGRGSQKSVLCVRFW